jgi:two-component system KDP operon response regulator KdpE
MGSVRPCWVCDSDLQSLGALRAVLRGSGLVVWPTQSAEEALARAALRAPDAAIIEMDIADSSGTEAWQLLRQWSSMPLIVLSHVSDEDRMVEAFRAGVDDYLTRPFSPRELVVRLEAHMRRATVDHDEPVELWGDVYADLAARVIRRGGRRVRLTPIEYKLLSALVRNRGRLLTHNVLLRHVWGAAHAEDRQTLRTHMANLRRKLASPGSGGEIKTYPGVGYLLEARVGSSQSPPGSLDGTRPDFRLEQVTRSPGRQALLVDVLSRQDRRQRAGAA